MKAEKKYERENHLICIMSSLGKLPAKDNVEQGIFCETVL